MFGWGTTKTSWDCETCKHLRGQSFLSHVFLQHPGVQSVYDLLKKMRDTEHDIEIDRLRSLDKSRQGG